jgi:hypothetical protein
MVSFFKRKFLYLNFLGLLFIGLLSFAPQSSAQQVGPGCDPEFMKAMQQKGWLEAQREINIIGATISKPDSVFALGCFDSFKGGLSVQFSDGTAYDFSKVGSYLSDSFSHGLGGGHYGGSSTTTGDCTVMLTLWNNARCENLSGSPARLFTLRDMAGYDRGNFPSTCSASGDWSTNLDTFYGTKAANKSVKASFDDMKLFLDVTNPLSQLGSSGKCAKGIKTGITIKAGTTDIPEIICPNPGCISDGKSPPKCCDANNLTSKCE